MTSKAARVTRGLAYGAGLIGGAYAVYAGTTWSRFGHTRTAIGEDQDPLLDRFMPNYEVVDRHHVAVAAPTDVTFAAMCELNMEQSGLVRAIFKARQIALGGRYDRAAKPAGLLASMQAIGWRVLDERPGHEVILGAVTRPWDANVVFRPIAPEAFAMFAEPDYVKIAWTLRADPVSGRESIVRTETRAVATDRTARAKFRRYWSIFSPGIVLIRRVMLRQVKRDAEHRFGATNAKRVDRFELVSSGDLDAQC